MKMSWDEAPEQYWHCYVSLPGRNRDDDRAVVNDLGKQQLKRVVIDPWLEGRTFSVGGTIVRDRESVEEIQIVHTPQPKDYYAREHDSCMRASGIADLVTDRRFIPFERGTDFTHELLFDAQQTTAPAPNVAILLRLCTRISSAARALAARRKGKAPFIIDDEYDAQDLLHALVRGYFKYSVTEEPMGRVGGGQSSRADLAIEDLGVLMEVKYVRSPNDQNRIVEEFAHDLLLYSKWAPLKTFIYVVVNAHDLRDPEALEKLSGTHEVTGKRYETHVVLA